MSFARSLDAEALEVFGVHLTSAEPLPHGEKLTVTRGVWRVTAGDRSAIRKVIGPDDDGSATLGPAHFRYWRREALLYEQGLPPAYLAAGISAPALLGRFDQPDGTIALWLSDVAGRPGASWSVDDFGRAACRLGRAQGSRDIPSWPWLSRDFLRHYLARWNDLDYGILTSSRAWSTPLVRGATADLDLGVDAVREGLVRLHESRERYLRWLSAAPQTFCHLDFWPHNLFAEHDATIVIDWGFCGVGALGEDIGNLVPDSVFDLLQPSAALPDLDHAVFDSYIAGLRDAGWDGDPRIVRLAMCASAVKYCWLAPRMLTRAIEGSHRSYGGGVVDDPFPQYKARFAGLAFLVGWAQEASRLADELRLGHG